MIRTADTDLDRDLAAIDAQEQRLYEGLRTSDVALLGRVLSDDATYVHSSAVAETKRENLIGQESGLFRHGTVVRVNGGTTVHGGLAHTSGAVEMVDSVRDTLLHLEQTLVWVREAAGWRLLLRQATTARTGAAAPVTTATRTPTTAPVPPGEMPDPAGAVAAAEERFRAAQAASDVVELDALLSDRLDRWVASTGAVETKAEYLGKVASGQHRYGRTRVVGGRTHVAGSGAVTIGVVDLPLLPPGGTPLTVRINEALVWALEDGHWRLVGRQATRQAL